MKQVKQVHLLPTDKAVDGGIILLLPDRKLSNVKSKNIANFCNRPDKDGKVIPQHIYFTDNSEIKEGDYFLNNKDIIFPRKVTEGWISKGYKKVIASTDKEITPNSSIPESFVKKYIEMYNAGTPITEVNVEYEEIPNNYQPYQSNKNYTDIVPANFIKVIKTREDGSIIISISRLYTELEMAKAFQAGGMHCATEGKVYERSPNFEQFLENL